MKKISNSGFSLLEVIIYIAVIAVVTSAVGAVLLSVANSQARSDAVAEINFNLDFSLNKIERDIQAASAVTAPAAAGGTADSLTLKQGVATAAYCLVSGQIFRSADGVCDATDEPITSPKVMVKNLVFTRLENTNSVLAKTMVSIQVLLTIGYSGSSSSYQYSATKEITASLR